MRTIELVCIVCFMKEALFEKKNHPNKFCYSEKSDFLPEKRGLEYWHVLLPQRSSENFLIMLIFQKICAIS